MTNAQPNSARSENARRARETRDAIEKRAGGHRVQREFHRVLDLAQQESAARGATSVEAEHLLLALAALPESRGGGFLLANGLDRATLEAALVAEREHSLGAVGAPLFAESELTAVRRKGRPRWGASARDTFERGMRISRGRDHVSTLNLVVGALIAELGTVPRMLTLAGFDRHQILGRATVEASTGRR